MHRIKTFKPKLEKRADEYYNFGTKYFGVGGSLTVFNEERYNLASVEYGVGWVDDALVINYQGSNIVGLACFSGTRTGTVNVSRTGGGALYVQGRDWGCSTRSNFSSLNDMSGIDPLYAGPGPGFGSLWVRFRYNYSD